MPRFLTPAKISLLLLIDLYAAGEIPSQAKLHVLVFLSEQINSPSDFDGPAIEKRLQLSASDVSTLSKVLSQWTSDITGRTIYDSLLDRLWQLNDLDGIFVLFKHLAELHAPSPPISGEAVVPKISHASPLGQFIRRCCYEFERIQFADVQKLWAAFVSYRASSYQVWAEKNPEYALRSDELDGIPMESLDLASKEYTSTQDIDSILNLSIQHLQRLGSRVPSNVKSNLRDWFEAQHDANVQSLQHFLAFFDHWRASQMSMALEALHQYFDYSVGANRTTENLKVYFQYAQLHQSVLFADFECWEESVEAMRECIGTARENQDTACLNFALSWLLHLRQVHPDETSASFESLIKLLGGSSEHDEIAFLKAKAREMKHWSLMSSTLLEEAKLELYCGGNVSRAFEHILQSMFLNVQHDQRTIMPAAALFESASLERLGQSRMAYRVCESVPLLYSSYTPLSDHIRTACRIAHVLAQMGQYSRAQSMLDTVGKDVTGVTKLQNRITACKALVEAKRLLHRGQNRDAKEILFQLRSLRASGGSELEFEIKVLDVEHLLRVEEYDKALEAVNSWLGKLKVARMADIAQRLHLLTVKSKIFAAAGQHTKGFSIALRAALVAERHRLISVLVEALAVLSTIFNALGEFEGARGLAEATLPHALGGANVQLQAELFSILADAHVGLAGGKPHRSTEQLRHLGLAVTYIERSRATYSEIEDVAGMSLSLVKKATLQRARGDAAAAALTDGVYARMLADHSEASVGNGSAQAELAV